MANRPDQSKLGIIDSRTRKIFPDSHFEFSLYWIDEYDRENLSQNLKMLPNLLSSINVCASNGHQHEFPRAKEGISVLGFSSKAPYKNKLL